jgi:drug/metabolite transporter (DMT)-like permease
VIEGRREGLGAIVLWGLLAVLALRLSAVPPFLLTGLALLIGSLVGGRALLHPPPPLAALALGVYGLFGFHFFLFLALRLAPPVEANLVNYLWPLLIVVLAPAIVPGVRFSARHGLAAALGFAGAALLITAGSAELGEGRRWVTPSPPPRRSSGRRTRSCRGGCATSRPRTSRGSASSRASRRSRATSRSRPRYWPRDMEWLYLVALGLGPMGAAFFLWDRAMKHGDPRAIGNLAYLTPLLSTLALAAFGGATLTANSLVAMTLILAGAWLGR